MSAIDDLLHIWGEPIGGKVLEAQGELASLRAVLEEAKDIVLAWRSGENEADYSELINSFYIHLEALRERNA